MTVSNLEHGYPRRQLSTRLDEAALAKVGLLHAGRGLRRCNRTRLW